MSIQLEQVTKDYAGMAAVKDVSVDISEGELFVLLGPSGSGKSTLLRAIAGLTTIDRGRIILHGRDVTHLGAKEREVGFVFQNYALFPHMTVTDNIEFALRARRVRAAQRKRRRSELLKLVSLEGFDHRLPSELSGGQQQRVAVARALAHEPRVLLLDEPFGALDARIREELRRAIREIQRAVGITTILVTHDQEEAFGMADRVGVMDRGRLQDVGEPRALYSRPKTRFVATFLGAANLLLGRYDRHGVKVGQRSFAVERTPRWLHPGDEVTVVVRPEDIVLAAHERELRVPVAGSATIGALEFVGSVERIRLSVPTSESLTSARHPQADWFALEACRPTREIETFPLTLGQQVAVGIRHAHILCTPLSSLRLVAADGSASRLAASPLVRELAARMHIEPVQQRSEPGARVPGLPIVSLDDSPEPLAAALEVLQDGSSKVLAVGHADRRPERMLVYVESSLSARETALAAAASFARHLGAEVTMLVRAGETSYRAVLDLRNAALKIHGLDVRTVTFRGSAGLAIRTQLDSSEAATTLLVIGLASASSVDGLIRDLDHLSGRSRPAAVLLLRGERQPQTHSLEGAPVRRMISAV